MRRRRFEHSDRRVVTHEGRFDARRSAAARTTARPYTATTSRYDMTTTYDYSTILFKANSTMSSAPQAFRRGTSLRT